MSWSRPRSEAGVSRTCVRLKSGTLPLEPVRIDRLRLARGCRLTFMGPARFMVRVVCRRFGSGLLRCVIVFRFFSGREDTSRQ